MKRETILIALGILIVLAPFSGLPQSWLEFVLPALGLMVVAAGYTFRTPRHEQDLQTNIPIGTSSPIGQ